MNLTYTYDGKTWRGPWDEFVLDHEDVNWFEESIRTTLEETGQCLIPGSETDGETPIIIYSEDFIESLSEKIVDGWDMDTLVSYGRDRLSEFYTDNPHLIAEEIEESGIEV